MKQPSSAWRDFHNKSLISVFSKGKKRKWNIDYKSYGRFEEVKLPHKSTLMNTSLKQSLLRRSSVRIKKRSLDLSLNEIGTLLYYSAGLNPAHHNRRFYPSAGARYPLEIYLIPLRTELSNKFTYHYYVPHNTLEKMFRYKKEDVYNLFSYSQKWIKNVGCVLVITTMFERSILKYGERGYRYMLIEAGHLGQNIYLVSSALQMNCCAIGAYKDKKLNDILHINEQHELSLYVLALSKTK